MHGVSSVPGVYAVSMCFLDFSEYILRIYTLYNIYVPDTLLVPCLCAET